MTHRPPARRARVLFLAAAVAPAPVPAAAAEIVLAGAFTEGGLVAGEAARALAVAARTYNVQRIDGLPAAQVSPPAEVLARIAAENRKIGAARAAETPQAWYAGGFR